MVPKSKLILNKDFDSQNFTMLSAATIKQVQKNTEVTKVGLKAPKHTQARNEQKPLLPKTGSIQKSPSKVTLARKRSEVSIQ